MSHDEVIKHATAIEQMRVAEKDVQRVEGELANLRKTLESRRQAVAKFEGGQPPSGEQVEVTTAGEKPAFVASSRPAKS